MSVGLCRCVCADGELMGFFFGGKLVFSVKLHAMRGGQREKVDCAGNGDAARMEIKLL